MKTELFDYLDDLTDYEDIEEQLIYSGSGLQFVTFLIKGEKYALDITRVREFIAFSQITSMPNLPNYIKGVINLRGSIIPVVDLRAKFNLEELEYDKYTVIVIAEMASKKVGMVVDSVSDVVFLPEDQIQPPPDFATHIGMEYITGMCQHKDDLVILLDSEKLLSMDELMELTHF
ncbi:MAG: purine-binding chemotaxis protein CheW [Proteobacteria bacterium]|nr:purine-binding chemotaxis protein CheW [Pseudomonadota bacterium]